MPSPPRRVYSVRDRNIDDDSERFAHDSSNLDEYFVAPETSAFGTSAASLTAIDAPYSRPSSPSTLPRMKNPMKRTWTRPTLRLRRSPSENITMRNKSVAVVEKQLAYQQEDERCRRGVLRTPSPPPRTSRFPFFTRQEALTPLTLAPQRVEDEDDKLLSEEEFQEIYGASSQDKLLTEEEYQQIYGDLSPPPPAKYTTMEERKENNAYREERQDEHSPVELKGGSDRDAQASLNDGEGEDGVERSLGEELSIDTTYNPPTRLHEVCRYSKTVDELMRTEKQYLSVQSAGCSDDQGQTPMHVLAQNHQIAHNLATVEEDEHNSHSFFERDSESQAEKQMRQFVVGVLLKAYPAAMMTCDSQGHIPFEGPLVEWVNKAHESAMPGSHSTRHGGTSDYFPARFTSFWMSTHTMTSRSMQTNIRQPSYLNVVEEDQTRVATSPTSTKSNKEDVEAPDSPGLLSPRNRNRMLRQAANGRERFFPTKVALTAHAHFCFQILSAILDQLDRLQLSKSTTRRSIFLQRPDADDDTCSIHSAVQELENLTVQDIGTEIVQSIASIPGFVKTILLLEDDDQRNLVLSTSLFRRVLVSKYSVGRWLTGMLQSDEQRVWVRAVEYLKLASDPSCHMLDQGSSLRSGPKKKSRTIVTEEPDELYQEVAALQDFVPSLLSLGEKEVEDVATTVLVRRVLDRIIARPFTLTVIFCDALFLAILICSYRGAVNRFLIGSPPGDVLVYIYVANAGIFYFIIREIGKAVSLCMITRRARIYFWSFWNVTDLLATILPLVSTVAIRMMFISRKTPTNVDYSNALRILLAVTTGFLWLRVLNFLKGINRQLATFVLAILQITRDVLWFCVILLTLVVSFAQMFFTLIVPPSCSSGETDVQECSQSEYYLKVYAILLGDFGTFERENFDSVFSVFLVVVYSFMVVLVLLNVLIAVASDSYEKCLLRSQSLFGRARVTMIAELVSFQNLLRRNALPNTAVVSPTAPIYKTWWSSDSWARGWSRGSAVFFSLSSLVVFIWVIGEMAGYLIGARHGNVFLSMGSVLINVALFIGIMMFLSTGAADTGSRKNVFNGGNDENGRFQLIGLCYNGFLKHAMNYLLGSSNEKEDKSSIGDDWSGRLVFLQREMGRISEATKEDSKQTSKVLENAITQTEERLRSEVTSLEKGLADMRMELKVALQSANEREGELQQTMRQVLEIFRDTGVNK